MSNISNESEPISVEKIRSSYPDISCLVNESASKITESSNDSPQLYQGQVTVTHAKVSTTTNPCQKVSPVSATISKKIPQVSIDRKVPPYVNVTLSQDPVRANKTFSLKTTPKILSKSVYEKTNESVVFSLPQSNNKASPGDGKKLSPQIIRHTTPVSTKPKAILTVEKVSGSLSGAEETPADSPKNSVEKNSPIPLNRTVFEKNIQSNVLTVTSRSAKTTPSKLLHVKDIKTNIAIESSTHNKLSPLTTSKSPSQKPNLPTESLCKSFSKTVSVQAADTPKTSRFVSTNNVNKNEALTKTIISKAVSSSTDSKSTSQKIMIEFTSSETSSKIPEEKAVTKSISSKSVTSPSVTGGVKHIPKTTNSPSSSSLSSTPSPSSKIQAYAESFSIPSAPSHVTNNKNVMYAVTPPSGNLQLTSLSELENNKDLREALNSGSTASLGENVTISSAVSSVEFLVLRPINARPTNDPKIRNVSSETTIENITKQTSGSNSPITRAKNNPNDGTGVHVNQSPKSCDSNASTACPSPADSRSSKREVANSLTSDGEMESGSETAIKKKVDEPVECLTISSDEETEPEHFISSLSDNSDVSVSIMNKEPPVGRDEDVVNRSYLTEGSIFEKECDDNLDATSGESYINLNCRTVRIGSYKAVPRNCVTLSKYGLRIVVPGVNSSNENVTLKIAIHDVVRVLVHFNRSLPVIFYYLNAQAGAKVRNALKMTDSGNCYFDPASEDESHRRITLLPEKFTDANKMTICELYEDGDILAELTHNEANQLLVRSAPKEIQKVMKQVPPNPVQTIMVFPPPPAKGGISINTEDYSCLAEDVFLNDVIIDFYLKYLFLNKLSEEDRQKTHIFSSFFYKRLTDKATPVPKFLQSTRSSDSITAAEIRHSRVKNWTKNIDIFSKDYIVIPLNENQHWFLAIICFPGLKGPVRFSDNAPINLDSTSSSTEPKTETDRDSDGPTMTIGSTTITPLRIENAFSVIDEDNDLEDRDEADGADEDINTYTSSEDSDDDYSDEEIKIKENKKPEREPIKQPCILIFDSLAGASRARIIATLREYLHVEYKAKHKGEERDFSKNVVKGACPRVPQQTNYTDCGLYVLQYVESFFESKITDFHIPIKILRDWFSSRTVSTKRYEIQQLLLGLMAEQNINVENLHLPELHLSPHSQYYEYYDDDDDDDDVEGEGEEHEFYDEEDLEHAYEYELEEGVEHDGCSDDDGDAQLLSKYQIYDDSDGSHEMDGESEENNSDPDLYNDLEPIDVIRSRCRRSVYTMSKNENNEETIHEEEEDVGEEEEEEDEEQVTNERISYLSNENITISRMSSRSETSNETPKPKNSSLSALKAARPWKQIRQVNLDGDVESGCSSKKKFKSN